MVFFEQAQVWGALPSGSYTEVAAEPQVGSMGGTGVSHAGYGRSLHFRQNLFFQGAARFLEASSRRRAAHIQERRGEAPSARETPTSSNTLKSLLFAFGIVEGENSELLETISHIKQNIPSFEGVRFLKYSASEIAENRELTREFFKFAYDTSLVELSEKGCFVSDRGLMKVPFSAREPKEFAAWLSKHASRIREVWVSQTHLFCLPNEISALKNVRSIAMPHTGLFSLPRELNVPSLEFLNLTGNSLRKFSKRSYLPSLSSLFLNKNQIRVFPRNFGASIPNIRVLSIGSNPLRELPDLSGCSQSVSLSIEETPLAEYRGVSCLPDEIRTAAVRRRLESSGQWPQEGCGVFTQRIDWNSFYQAQGPIDPSVQEEEPPEQEEEPQSLLERRDPCIVLGDTIKLRLCPETYFS